MEETMAKPKALLLFSGGLDSVVLLNDLIDAGYEVHPMFIHYSQKGFNEEFDCFHYWIQKFGLEKTFKILDLPAMSWSKSTIGNRGVETGDSFKDEYMEMRNMIFISYAASYAQAKGIPQIYTGFIHTENYNDTDEKFTKAIDLLLTVSAGISVIAPYQTVTKEGVVELARDDLQMDMEELFTNSMSCNTPAMGKPCGKCYGCQEIDRLKKIFL